MKKKITTIAIITASLFIAGLVLPTIEASHAKIKPKQNLLSSSYLKYFEKENILVIWLEGEDGTWTFIVWGEQDGLFQVIYTKQFLAPPQNDNP